jgi:hypothetical protein
MTEQSKPMNQPTPTVSPKEETENAGIEAGQTSLKSTPTGSIHSSQTQFTGRPGGEISVKRLARLSLWMVFLAAAAVNEAASLPVPNGSFESPSTSFVDLRIDAWQKNAKPDWYDESGGFLWDQLCGVFLNTPPGSGDHIENCHGAQAIFLFAVPQTGLFIDYDSTDWTSSIPTHAFDVKFEVGRAYQLSLGVLGTGGMTNGASLMVGVYYRDSSNRMVVVQSTNIVYNRTLFPDSTHFQDYGLWVPPVKAGDAWANRHIGIQILSITDPSLAGGYWDLDHVRLESMTEPILSQPRWLESQFQFTLQSEPGLKFEIEASSEPALPSSPWTRVGTVTNESGIADFVDASPPAGPRFYRARQVP